MDIRKLVAGFSAFVFLCLIGFMVYTLNYSRKIDQLIENQNEIMQIQQRTFKIDSLNNIKEFKYRETLNTKINSLTDQLDVLESQNDYIISKNQVKIEKYKENKYKPLKYW